MDHEDLPEIPDTPKRTRPILRSMISRGSTPVRVTELDEDFNWRTTIKMMRKTFDDDRKAIFLREYAKWGRMGESAAAAGVTAGTVRGAMARDPEFAEAMIVQEDEYRDKLVSHHQNLLFHGTIKKTFDRTGKLVGEETIYPIRLIEMELKKHDEGYRDKREVKVDITGGVLVAPAETANIEDWEKRFSPDIIDITPDDDEEDRD